MVKVVVCVVFTSLFFLQITRVTEIIPEAVSPDLLVKCRQEVSEGLLPQYHLSVTNCSKICRKNVGKKLGAFSEK